MRRDLQRHPEQLDVILAPGVLMASYETLRETLLPFGDQGAYLEVSRRRLVEGGACREFVVITRGFVERDGTKRWTRFVTLPDEPGLRARLADALQTL